ncbi:VanZ family protein [Fusibacter bizertensis]|uniref:VanZ family protein n=1 Tax=Fusibacter bizertensis TaxID=1488331 RepID=A0ABT6NF30_9FIRM|nr:VanZ family protein [Fusibacter bizertensis]MDH8679025.1 VanZ family protein [Fusibacter bizertensis]
MDTYLFPIKIAILTFPLFAFVFTLPFAIFQYKKYGYINKFRIFILFSFLLFLIVAFYLVILPLPASRDIKSTMIKDAPYYNLVPFTFVADLMREANFDVRVPETYQNLLTERTFLQAAFNILMLMPFGIFLRYYFKYSFKKTIILTLLLSLFFEVTQLTGLYGMYNAPYRLFDVDDLFLNTMGGAFGYIFAPFFTFFLPKPSTLDNDVNLEAMRVSLFRRTLALGIDWFALGLFARLYDNLLIEAAVYFTYFILIVTATNGRTLGKWLTSTKVKGAGEKLTFKEAFIRYGLLYFGFFGLIRVLGKAIDILVALQDPYSIWMTVFAVAILAVIDIMFLVHLILNSMKKDRFFYEKMSHTQLAVSK